MNIRSGRTSERTGESRGAGVRWLVRAAVLTALLAIYLPDLGHGFVQDDFAWILRARGAFAAAVAHAFTSSAGFYRPLVQLSFTVSEWTFGLGAYGYGVTNLLLMLACILGVERLARRAGLTAGSALLASAVWALNFHGINMAVLWISGRTSLLLTLCALLAALAWQARRSGQAAWWTALALFSKEEAVLLPLILVAWRLLDSWAGGPEAPPRPDAGDAAAAVRSRGGSSDSPATWRPLLDAAREAWPLFAALVVYLILRVPSGAYTPGTAPDAYRFTSEIGRLWTNAWQYLDRSATASAIALILLTLTSRQLPRLDAAKRIIALRGVAWWLGGFAITFWLPVRSSLYAVFPSVGIVLILAAAAESLLPALPPKRARLALAAGLLLPFLLLPIYRTRNQRWVELADLTTATLTRLQVELERLPDQAIVELHDDRTVRANFINAFGALHPEAAQLFLDRQIELRIDPPPDGAADDERAAALRVELAEVAP